MRTKITFSLTLLLVMFLVSCSNNPANQAPTNSVETVAAIVNATLSAFPTSAPPTFSPTIEFTPTAEPTEETVILPTPTNTPIPILAPLYWELTWENLGLSEQEVSLNSQTSERVTLAGYTYQAPFPMDNDTIANNVFTYYSNENMANMGWMFVGGWGGTEGILTEFYSETGYFLTIRHTSGQSQSMTVWISDETAVVPVIPPSQ